MQTEIQEGLKNLFKESLELKFSKKLYEANFKMAYEHHQSLFARIIEACEHAEDRSQVIQEIAAVIPAQFKEEMGQIASKRKREARQIDYNAAMVTYVLPLLTYSHNEACETIADIMVEQWNDSESTMKIKRAHFEEIQGGFKSRLCYVTTAVCESLNKGDDCYELNLLREYRDEYLARQPEGEEIIKEYYDIAPTIVKRINRLENSHEVYLEIWEEYLNPCILLIEREERKACRDLYIRMVRDLQKKYICS